MLEDGFRDMYQIMGPLNEYENEIYYGGTDSYAEYENPRDADFLLKLIAEADEIVEIGLKKMKNPNLIVNKKRDVHDPYLYFSMVFDCLEKEDATIRNEGLKIQNAIVKLLNDVSEKYDNFCYSFHPMWNENILTFSFEVRPIRGLFVCPFCGNKTKDPEFSYVMDGTAKKNIMTCALCSNDNRETFVI